jgi:hypothetical protein
LFHLEKIGEKPLARPNFSGDGHNAALRQLTPVADGLFGRAKPDAAAVSGRAQPFIRVGPESAMGVNTSVRGKVGIDS